MSPDSTNQESFERLPDGDLSSVARSDATEWENIVPFERPTADREE